MDKEIIAYGKNLIRDTYGHIVSCYEHQQKQLGYHAHNSSPKEDALEFDKFQENSINYYCSTTCHSTDHS